MAANDEAVETEGEPEPAPERRELSAEDLACVAGLSDKERAKALEMFRKHDADESGRIERGELATLLETLNVRLDGEQWEAFIERNWLIADVDGGGDIDEEEFLFLFAKVFAPANRYGQELRLAAGRGEVAHVLDLVHRGCDPNGADGRGWTSLHHAAQYGCQDVCEALLGAWPALNINARDNYGWTPAMNAAASGHCELLRLLAARGANLSLTSHKGRSAVHWAAAKGQGESVRVLAAEGVDVNLEDEVGWTALHCAWLHGHRNCIVALVELGARTDSLDAIGHDIFKYCDEDDAQLIRTTSVRPPSAPASRKPPAGSPSATDAEEGDASSS